MKNYPYFQRFSLQQVSQEEYERLPVHIARRALDGGDARQLLEMLHHLPRSMMQRVLGLMQMESEGCKMLYVLLWLKRNSFYDIQIQSMRDLIEEWSEAEDGDEIISYLEEHAGLIRCDDCGEWEYHGLARSTYSNGDDQVCRSCISDDYQWSDRYEDYVHDEYAEVAIDENGSRCTIHRDDDDFRWDDDQECYVHEDFDPDSRVIGNYHSSKNLQRVRDSAWTKLKRRYIGVELEVEVRNNDRVKKAVALHEHINGGEFGKNVFFENDGSLNDGFEIISQPMGLDAHRDLWSWLKDRDATKSLRSHNTSTCGLHVHISREGMSKLQIAKIVTFINDPDNEELIRAVARRYAEGYCRIKEKTIGKAHYSEDRYEAVNITPRKTIEFRIFKGSLKYESVMAAIQFSNAVVEFCGRANKSITQLKADEFMHFIRNECGDDTDVLVPYLEQRLELA